MLRIVKLDCLKIYSNDTIGTILSKKDNINIFFSSKCRDALLFFKRNLSWLVIINNCNSSSAVPTGKVLLCIWVN